MAPPKGSQYWKLRETHGRPLLYETPEKIWDAAVSYFEWVTENPLEEDSLVTFQGEATHEPIAKMRAMTVKGLCLHLGIGFDAWNEYRKRDGFKETCAMIDDIIYVQKFEGASAGLLNHSIIARELGLADKSELSGPGGKPIETKETSETDWRKAAREVAFLLAKATQKK